MEEVSDILNKAGFDEEVVKIFRVNKIDRSLLVALDKDDMKELGIVALGDRKKLQMLIATLQNMRTTDVPQATQTSSSTSGDLSLSQPGSVTASPSPLGLMSGDSNSVHTYELDSDIGAVTSACSSPGEMESIATPPNECNNEAGISTEGFGKDQQAATTSVTIMSTVPNYLDGWEEDFRIPTQFSEATMQVLTSRSMSKSARKEIVQMTASKMLNYCKYPSEIQYHEVGKKIVNGLLHGKKDSSGSGYGSWSKALETRFRNMRRKPRSHGTGLDFSPPTKKKKIQLGNHGYNPYAYTLLDEETYELHLSQLHKQLSKKTKNKASLLSLMAETAANRRKWIIEERPTVSDVLNKFPTLQEFDMILGDFCNATNIEDPVSIVLSKWNAWVPKIFHKAKLEGQNQKKTFKEYMPIVLECTSQPVEDICKHPDIAIVLILLRKLLNEKMSKSCTELLVILEDGESIEEVISSNDAAAPFIVQVGSTATRQWFIAVEKETLTCVQDIVRAVIAMMAYYYVFDISYPKEWRSCLLFIEKYFFNIKDGPALKPSQLGTISDIESISF